MFNENNEKYHREFSNHFKIYRSVQGLQGNWFICMYKQSPIFVLLTKSLFSQATYKQLLVWALLLHRSSQAKRRNKRVFNYCQTSVLYFTNGGILSGYQSLLASHLSGTPSLKTGTRPPNCLLLDNCLYIWFHFLKISPKYYGYFLLVQSVSKVIIDFSQFLFWVLLLYIKRHHFQSFSFLCTLGKLLVISLNLVLSLEIVLELKISPKISIYFHTKIKSQ